MAQGPAAYLLGIYFNPPMQGGTAPTISASPDVKIAGVPALRVNDSLPGPVADSVLVGSTTVRINGFPAARVTDNTKAGGMILTGSFNTIIGG